MKKVLLYSVVIIASLALIMWKLNNNKKENAAKTAIVKESSSGAVPVLTEVAGLIPFDPTFQTNGSFTAIQQINFSAEAPGRITALMVKEGSVVKTGQVLARIDNQVANADLENAEVSVSAAARDMERYEKALSSGGVTQKQVDDMKLQYQSATARLAQAKKNAQNTLLKSPIDGIVNAKFVEVGTYLAAGNKLFEIVNISRLKLVVSVPESQVVQIHLGQEVPVTTNVFPELTYKGKITFIAAKGDETLNYPVEIEVANIAGKELKAGMYGTAVLNLPKREPALLIGRAAFYAGVSNNQIFVAENGVARSRKVVSGNIYGDKVEVKSGLRQGETVITSGQVNLVDGTPISIQK
jgi:membrane fusion protein, multidrug efflux system